MYNTSQVQLKYRSVRRLIATAEPQSCRSCRIRSPRQSIVSQRYVGCLQMPRRSTTRPFRGCRQRTETGGETGRLRTEHSLAGSCEPDSVSAVAQKGSRNRNRAFPTAHGEKQMQGSGLHLYPYMVYVGAVTGGVCLYQRLESS